MINEKHKIYKMSQWNNQISFQDITNECEVDILNKTLEKVKLVFKKDEAIFLVLNLSFLSSVKI